MELGHDGAWEPGDGSALYVLRFRGAAAGGAGDGALAEGADGGGERCVEQQQQRGVERHAVIRTRTRRQRASEREACLCYCCCSASPAERCCGRAGPVEQEGGRRTLS
eukprot:COSAG02_NODE_8515_length_2540_cov_17.770746_2_plen_108_part_00